MITTIQVIYWCELFDDKVGIPHNYTVPYSYNARLRLINQILKAGFNVMITQSGKIMTIAIDNKRFGQR